MGNLMVASRQWATRPADERYWTLADLHAAAVRVRESSRESRVDYHDLAVDADGDELAVHSLSRGADARGRLSHWAMAQLSARVGAPAGYLRTLPAPMAAGLLTHGLRTTRDADEPRARVLWSLDTNGAPPLLRAFTGSRYGRVWTADVTRRLLDWLPDGWRTPPGRPPAGYTGETRIATAADVLSGMGGGGGLSVNVGDVIAASGLYMGDRDSFVFLINPDRPIREDGASEPLYPGAIIWNSEVGARSWATLSFLFRHVCGNHIVWSAEGVREIRVRHVGDADARSSRWLVEMTRFADGAASETEARITWARRAELGATKDEVLDTVLARVRHPEVTRARVGAAYESTERLYPVDGSPRSPWGIAQGLTRLSQLEPYADGRMAADLAAGLVLSRLVRAA